MQGFINVVIKGGRQRLMPIDKIMSVFELEDGRAFIGTEKAKRHGYGFETLESYSEVIKKIEEAVK